MISGDLSYKLNSSNCYWTTNGYAQQMNEPLPIADLTYPYDYDSDSEPANALNGVWANLLSTCCTIRFQLQNYPDVSDCIKVHYTLVQRQAQSKSMCLCSFRQARRAWSPQISHEPALRRAISLA